jgi:hypothetical protein
MPFSSRPALKRFSNPAPLLPQPMREVIETAHPPIHACP